MATIPFVGYRLQIYNTYVQPDCSNTMATPEDRCGPRGKFNFTYIGHRSTSVYIIRHDPFALTRHPHPGTLMNHGAHIIRPKVVNISADRHPGYPMTQIE